MHSNGYHHADVHLNNIMTNNIKDPNSYRLIDYGCLLHTEDKNNLTKREKLYIKHNLDYVYLLDSFLYDHVFDLVNKSHLTNYKSLAKKCRIHLNRLKIQHKELEDIACLFLGYCLFYRDYLLDSGVPEKIASEAKQDPFADFAIEEARKYIQL